MDYEQLKVQLFKTEAQTLPPQKKVPICRGFDTQCPRGAARKVNSKVCVQMVQRQAYWQASACDFNSARLSQRYGFVELEVYLFKIAESKYVIQLFLFLP